MTRTVQSWILLCAAVSLSSSPSGPWALASGNQGHTPAIFDAEWELVETYDHDRASFTQGLEIHPSSARGTCDSSSCPSPEESLLVMESTGMHGDSLIRIWDLHTGKVHKEHKMDNRFFGEGSTFFVDDDGNEKIAVLTYQEESILVYDAETLELKETLVWPSPTTTREGWGLAFDPARKMFLATDGSEFLHFWNTDFEETQTKLPVRISYKDDVHNQRHIPLLNELEWDASTNTLLANRWGEEIVLRIDPVTGMITHVYNFSSLYPRQSRGRVPPGYRREDVFNGIAIVPNTDGKEWLVTGKWWPKVYRIRIKE